MNERLYFFSTEKGKFVFDGEAVSIYHYEDIVDLEIQQTSYLPLPDSHRSHFLRTVCLILNNSCNLCCKYCYAHQGLYDKPFEQLRFEKGVEAIDYISKSAMMHNSNNITIAFFGGEPLLSFNLIKKLVSYAENKYPKLIKKYQITTNGTLINDSIAEFMEKYNFNIMISIDGGKEHHNKYRRFKNGMGSYDDVVLGASLIQNKELLNARITITDVNVLMHEYIDTILNLGIKRITFAVDYNITDDNFALYLESIKNLTNKYITDIKSGVFYEITNFTKILSLVIFHNKIKNHCNAGISYITLSADGRYYLCPRFVGMSKFCIGTDDNAVERYKYILENKLKNSAADRSFNCKNCCFAFICGGVCMHHAYTSTKNIFGDVSKECEERKTVFKSALKLLCSLSVSERRNFLLFLTEIWHENNFKEVNSNEHN